MQAQPPVEQQPPKSNLMQQTFGISPQPTEEEQNLEEPLIEKQEDDVIPEAKEEE